MIKRTKMDGINGEIEFYNGKILRCSSYLGAISMILFIGFFIIIISPLIWAGIIKFDKK